MIKLLSKIEIHDLLLIVIALFPIYTMGMISVGIFILVFYSVIYFLRDSKQQKANKIFQQWLIIATGFYFWGLIATVYSHDTLNGFKEFQSSLGIILLPVIIMLLLPNLSDRVFKLINVAFVCANILLILFIHYFLTSKGVYSEFHQNTFWNLPVRTTLEVNPFKELHPTYIGLWFIYCFFYLLEEVIRKYKKLPIYKVIAIVIAMFLLLTTTIILSARMVFIALIITLILYLILRVKNKLLKYFIPPIVLIFTLVLIFNSSFLKARIVDEISETELVPPVGLEHNSTNIRVGIYICSFEIIKENWLTGVGIGNVKKKLNNCYEQFDTNAYSLSFYNTHNQYLHILISSGIMGLFLFLFSLLKQVQIALRQKDFLYISFLSINIICLLSENLFERVNGVVFYAFFNSLFLKKCLQNQAK